MPLSGAVELVCVLRMLLDQMLSLDHVDTGEGRESVEDRLHYIYKVSQQ